MIESSGFISTDGKKTATDTSIEQITPLTERAGGTSLVYTASINGKLFFMKQLRPEYMQELLYRSMFMKEYELGRRIDNKHIIKYQTIDENANGLYLLAEYVKGWNIEEKIAAAPAFFKNPKNIQTLLSEILDGLSAMHKVGVVHLDLKPENIMLSQVNNQIKIVDLGFAFESSYINTAGRTLKFAAPEVQQGLIDEIDVRSDLYSVGKLMEYICQRCDTKLNKNTKRVIARCLQDDKSKRYSSAEEAIKDLHKEGKRMRKIVIASIMFIILLLAFPAAQILNGTYWFNDIKQYTERILSTVRYDGEFTHVYYKIVSHKHRTCNVVGSRLHPNPMIVDIVTINDKEYSVIGIEDSAFWGAAHIRSVNIPDGIECIGKHAFMQCHNLSNIDLPSSINTLEHGAFYNCSNLESCKLSPNLTSIPADCFSRNKKLKEITVPKGVKKLGFDCFAVCENLKRITLPEGLLEIERGVFFNCFALEEITIPASVIDIHEFAFFHCKSLKNVYMHCTEPPIVSRIFMDNHPEMIIHVPAESVNAYLNAEHWREQNIVGDL